MNEKSTTTEKTSASEKFPYGYQSYDFEHLRQSWPVALERLLRDLAEPKSPIDWQEFARHYSLPPDWSWDLIKRRIETSDSPENAFNDLLRALYRAQKIETSGYPTDPDQT